MGEKKSWNERGGYVFTFKRPVPWRQLGSGNASVRWCVDEDSQHFIHVREGAFGDSGGQCFEGKSQPLTMDRRLTIADFVANAAKTARVASSAVAWLPIRRNATAKTQWI